MLWIQIFELEIFAAAATASLYKVTTAKNLSLVNGMAIIAVTKTTFRHDEDAFAPAGA
jgi:hypothetical protein